MRKLFETIASKAVVAIAGLFVIGVFLMPTASAQTTAFTYQGKLSDAGLPANGQYDLIFRLFTLAEGGSQIGADQAKDAVQVSAGIFTVTLDFGASPFTSGTARYLEISVRHPASTGTFVLLTPRQPLTSSPFSISTIRAAAADSLSAACISCVMDSHIASIDGRKVQGIVDQAGSAIVAGNVTGVVQIANGGTGSTTKNFVDTTTDQTGIAGNKTFTGVLSGNGSGLTDLNGANLAPNTVTASKLYFDPNVNVQQLALGRWYTANRSFASFSFGSTAVAMTFDGNYLWVVANSGGEIFIRRIKADTGAIETVPGSGSDGNAISMVFDGTNINIGTDQRKLLRINAVNPSTPAIVQLQPTVPNSLVFDGTYIYAGGTNSVLRIRASDGTLEGTIEPFAVDRGLIFDGTFLIGLSASSILRRYNVSTGVFDSLEILVSLFSRAAAFDGTFVNVAGDGCGCVARIRSSPPDTFISDAVQVFAKGTSITALGFDGVFVYAVAGSKVARFRASTGVLEGNAVDFGQPLNQLGFDGVNLYTQTNMDRRIVKF
jgi:hypothetical protein